MKLLSIFLCLLMIPNIFFVVCNQLVFYYVYYDAQYKSLLDWASFLACINFGCLAVTHWLFAMRYYVLSIKLGYG